MSTVHEQWVFVCQGDNWSRPVHKSVPGFRLFYLLKLTALSKHRRLFNRRLRRSRINVDRERLIFFPLITVPKMTRLNQNQQLCGRLNCFIPIQAIYCGHIKLTGTCSTYQQTTILKKSPAGYSPVINLFLMNSKRPRVVLFFLDSDRRTIRLAYWSRFEEILLFNNRKLSVNSSLLNRTILTRRKKMLKRSLIEMIVMPIAKFVLTLFIFLHLGILFNRKTILS